MSDAPSRCARQPDPAAAAAAEAVAKAREQHLDESQCNRVGPATLGHFTLPRTERRTGSERCIRLAPKQRARGCQTQRAGAWSELELDLEQEQEQGLVGSACKAGALTRISLPRRRPLYTAIATDWSTARRGEARRGGAGQQTIR